MAVLRCVIASPEGLVFDGDARSVVVPAADGELGFLPRHAPLVGALGSGEVRIEAAEDAARKTRYFIDRGFVQVLKNRVTVLATVCEPLESLDRAAAEARLKGLLSSPPPRTAALEERDAHLERIRAARRRVKLAR
ncbi:MAG: ATP synthase F1 subunit epsilon [Planctomycetes bacterium]|nr:ATP synthase F1 subunit epsilon [Planctomycetota bacterium]